MTGIAALHILNAHQPLTWGLNFEEFRIINIIIPLITIIGPVIAGPFADKLAAKNPVTFGRNLRIIIAILLTLACIFYGSLLAVPTVKREEARRPNVSFSCDSSGAVIFQERCTNEATCHHWRRGKVGSLILTNCSYTCQNPKQFENLYRPWVKDIPPKSAEVVTESEYHDYDDPIEGATDPGRQKRQIQNNEDSHEVSSAEKVPEKVFVEPPHLCTKRIDPDGHEVIDKCHVYTMDTVNLKVQATLRSATNSENDTHSADFCKYPLGQY